MKELLPDVIIGFITTYLEQLDSIKDSTIQFKQAKASSHILHVCNMVPNSREFDPDPTDLPQFRQELSYW